MRFGTLSALVAEAHRLCALSKHIPRVRVEHDLSRLMPLYSHVSSRTQARAESGFGVGSAMTAIPLQLLKSRIWHAM